MRVYAVLPLAITLYLAILYYRVKNNLGSVRYRMDVKKVLELNKAVIFFLGVAIVVQAGIGFVSPSFFIEYISLSGVGVILLGVVVVILNRKSGDIRENGIFVNPQILEWDSIKRFTIQETEEGIELEIHTKNGAITGIVEGVEREEIETFLHRKRKS